jgi:dTDP-4-dehydrorhamnose 3,5-epimerase
MTIIPTPLSGLLIIQPKVFTDARGYFYESYNIESFQKQGITDNFIQDNQSMSMKGAVRGLHFQKNPHAQAKLVRVSRGSVYDVVVDIRTNSPTYGQHFGIELSEKNHTQLYIPVGFAHGFATLEDHTIFQYKCSALYNKESEGGVFWKDKEIGIHWPVSNPILSDKDLALPIFKDFKSPF